LATRHVRAVAEVVGVSERTVWRWLEQAETTGQVEAPVRQGYAVSDEVWAHAAPSRATVHRVLARSGLIRHQQQKHRRKYKRWQRETPMHLWQRDLVGGIFLADGRECKMLTGIDDHSRFAVISTVLAVPSGRAVADAFVRAMRTCGVSAEVLTDNGKQFTGR
jgi:hypothetical protein